MKDKYREEPRTGEIWRHFCGDRYVIVGIGVHTETGEHFVIYRLEGACKEINAWCRPIGMFMSYAPSDNDKVAAYSEKVSKWRYDRVSKSKGNGKIES